MLNLKQPIKITLKIAIILPFIIALCSCSDSKKVVDLNLKYVSAKSTPTPMTNRNAEDQIAEAATAVGHSLQQLSALQMAVHPQIKPRKPFNAKAIGMGHLASISWTGPAELLLQRIADATHYRLQVIGKEPALPVIVSLDMKNKPLATILRNTTYQIITKASVSVYPRKRVIELRYHGN